MSTSACCNCGSTANNGAPNSMTSPSRTESVSTRPASSGLTKIRSASTQPWKPRSAGFEQAASASSARPIKVTCDLDMVVAPRAEQHVEMRMHHGAHVERLEAVEQSAPDDRNNAGRRQQLRKPHQRIGLELAALVRTAQHVADRRHDARDDLAEIELGQRRKTRPLREHQANDILAARAENFADEHLDQPVGHLAERNVS